MIRPGRARTPSATLATTLAVALALGVLARTARAHGDDPKALDTTPIYVGLGWLSGAAGAAAPMPQFPHEGIELLAWLPIGAFPGAGSGAANDCWGYVSPSGREYAIMGFECGTGFVEITDPGHASVITLVPGPCCTWRDIKTYGHHAYVVSECGAGIQVLDLGQIDAGFVTHIGDIDTGGTSSHNVAINTASGYLYRTGGSGNGLLVYDLRHDPTEPALVAAWSDRYVHDAQVVTMTSGPWADREIAFCCSGFNGGWVDTGLDILDVTDKDDIVVLARYLYPNGVYSHQGWLSEDRTLFYLGDELDEGGVVTTTTTMVIDVSDLEHPGQVATFTNSNTAVGHNLYVRGDLILQANYASGLRVFDAANPLAPVEIAYFDTRPTDDAVGYSGLWSNYPYFPSGSIIGSDRQRGLFVWRLEGEQAGDVDGNGTVDFIDLLILLSEWGDCPDPPAGCPSDLDSSRVVDFGDLLLLLANWS